MSTVAFEPMLATAANASPVAALAAFDDGWYFEPKYEGIRCIASVAGGRIQLRSRSGSDLTRSFPRSSRA